MIRFLSKTKKADLKGTALVRLDFNTEDEWRMRTSLPTIRFLRSRADKIVIVSHRGRPDPVSGKKLEKFDQKFSLRKDARQLSRWLRTPICFMPHFEFKKIRKEIADALRGSVFLLENVRFLKTETTPRPELARSLASLADYYVNDAFAVCHRAADSVSGIERFIPSYAGPELEKEVQFLSRVLARPAHPLVFIIGGGKAHDKLMVMKYFRKKADAFLLGGVAANTLICAKGMDVGNSEVDDDPKDQKHFRAVLAYPNLMLPCDWKMGKGKILDIGADTITDFIKIIRKARTIVWSGPLGFFEKKPYDRGTLAVARAIAANGKAFSLAGGGETVAFLKMHRLDKKFSFISTGGGAMLEFLAGKKLPGIEALKRSKIKSQKSK